MSGILPASTEPYTKSTRPILLWCTYLVFWARPTHLSQLWMLNASLYLAKSSNKRWISVNLCYSSHNTPDEHRTHTHYTTHPINTSSTTTTITMNPSSSTSIIALLFTLLLSACVAEPNEPCSVCGEGMEVGKPHAGLIPCGILETVGELGLIPAPQCAKLPQLIGVICECKSTTTTTTTTPVTTTPVTTTTTTPAATTTTTPATTTTTTTTIIPPEPTPPACREEGEFCSDVDCCPDLICNQLDSTDADSFMCEPFDVI